MKDNVDLTLNKKFSLKRDLNNIKRILFKSVTNVKFPWEINISKISFALDRNKSVILTGNKHDRKRKQMELDYENGNECDCCGIVLNRKPWSNINRLCNRCNNSLEEDSSNSSYWKSLRRKMYRVN